MNLAAKDEWWEVPQTRREYHAMVQAAPDWRSTQRLMRLYSGRFLREAAPVVTTASPPPKPQKLTVRLAKTSGALRVLSRKRRLFKQSPFCYWCGQKLVLELDLPTSHNIATIDHLYPRLHKAHQSNKHKVVLACRRCNHDRNVADHKGNVFIPKLDERADVARTTSVVCFPTTQDTNTPASGGTA